MEDVNSCCRAVLFGALENVGHSSNQESKDEPAETLHQRRLNFNQARGISKNGK
jgi:hypothetical protein